MKLSKIISRLRLRYKMIKKHPISGASPLSGISRYLYFNILQSIFPKPRVYNWINKLKFYAEKGDAGIVGNIYYKLMDYEESMFLIDHLKEEDLFIDVGANLGHYSLLASGICKAKVIAIEPIERTFNKLSKNVELNNLSDKVSIIKCGVGDKEETLSFTTNRSVMNRVANKGEKNTVEVEVKTLNNLLKGLHPTFIKIDVEGFELKVIKGANEIFDNPSLKYLLVEFNGSGNNYNLNDEDVYNLILSYNFTPINYNPKLKRIEFRESYNQNKFNTLFIKKGIA